MLRILTGMLAALAIMTSSAFAKDTIKIGLLVTQEGVFTVPGNDVIRLFKMALAEHKGQVAGKKIEWVLRTERRHARHRDAAGAQADRAGSGRHHHRPALGLRGHRAARLCQDRPRQDHHQRHLGRARDHLGRPGAELLPLQPRRLAVGLRPRQLRGRTRRAGRRSRPWRPTIRSATPTSSALRVDFCKAGGADRGASLDCRSALGFRLA